MSHPDEAGPHDGTGPNSQPHPGRPGPEHPAPQPPAGAHDGTENRQQPATTWAAPDRTPAPAGTPGPPQPLPGQHGTPQHADPWAPPQAHAGPGQPAPQPGFGPPPGSAHPANAVPPHQPPIPSMTVPPVPYPPMTHPAAPPLRTDYASWGRRVGATLIDNIPAYVYFIVFMIGYFTFLASVITSLGTSATVSPDLSSLPTWIIVIGALWLISTGWNIYNRWIKGGRTGQTLGKRILKITLISEQTGRPIGAGNAFLRDLVHILDGAAYVGYLWPLWDEKRQTFADKLMNTIVIDQPDQSATAAPPADRPTGVPGS